jgi:tripartite-type tricarboxylate transporter receptor subunit TctC
MKRILAIGLLSAVAGLPLLAWAQQQEPYPNRPVRLIAPSGPGGNPDVWGRTLSEKLSVTLGKPFVVENVPGAGGVVAANMVAKAPPDGHVLMLSDSGALAINPALQSGLSYDPIKDFTPITAVAALPTAFVVPPSLPAKTVAEFIALAKKDPGKLTFGSAGPGSIHHITMAAFMDHAGIDMLHVPYRGGTQMVNALLAGEVQGGWSGIPNVRGQIEGGLLRALCISVLTRQQSLPNVPTCDEVGVKGFDIATMLGLLGPAGMPAPIVATLQSEAAKALRDPKVAERMVQLGVVMEEKGTAHYQKYIRDDIERYGSIVRKLNLQIKN